MSAASVETISPSVALDLLSARRHAAIDVRSEGEFRQGSIPGFECQPILTDSERHEVGLAYKERGQAAAIDLGHALVGPSRALRVGRWQAAAEASASRSTILTCWRGGLRSQIASDWLAEAGTTVQRVEGGYKAMRAELLAILGEPPPLLVLAGMTGSGKTRLLAEFQGGAKVDLEAIAHHRGSSFGGMFDDPQPTQATFENALGCALREVRQADLVLAEDESAAIGQVYLPKSLQAALAAGAVVFLEVDRDERIRNVFAEYVAEPLAKGVEATRLRDSLLQSIARLGRRLGSALTRELQEQVTSAFAADQLDPSHHAAWIGRLLSDYYDKLYNYAFERSRRQVLFRGDYEECKQWISNRFA